MNNERNTTIMSTPITKEDIDIRKQEADANIERQFDKLLWELHHAESSVTRMRQMFQQCHKEEDHKSAAQTLSWAMRDVGAVDAYVDFGVEAAIEYRRAYDNS